MDGAPERIASGPKYHHWALRPFGAALRASTKIVWNNFEHPRFLRMARRVSYRDVANKFAPGKFVEPELLIKSLSHTIQQKTRLVAGCLLDGAPERIRTSDRSVRSRVLYPAELQAHVL